MITFYIFLTITAIELVVVVLKIRQIKEHIQFSKEIGIHIPYADHIDKVEKFLIRMYENYKGMLIILAVIVLFVNSAAAYLLYILYTLIDHII